MSSLVEIVFKLNGYKLWVCIVLFSIFKGFLSRAYKSCSEHYIDEEIQFLIDVFTENGYERKTLEKITTNYFKELQNPPVNKKNTKENVNKTVKASVWKKNIETIFTLLCQNKTKLLPNSFSEVYKLK